MQDRHSLSGVQFFLLSAVLGPTAFYLATAVSGLATDLLGLHRGASLGAFATGAYIQLACGWSAVAFVNLYLIRRFSVQLSLDAAQLDDAAGDAPRRS